jgi:hypothetical protein
MAITKCLIGEPGCNCAERKEASRTCPAGEPGCDCAEWEEDPWEGVEVEPEPDWWDGPTCTLCDGVGHGYPGSLRPCPLEDRGWGDEPDDRGRW